MFWSVELWVFVAFVVRLLLACYDVFLTFGRIACTAGAGGVIVLVVVINS